MQTIDWIIVGVMAAAVLASLAVVLRKWKVLRTIDVAAMPEVQVRKKKYDLIEQRLNRKVQGRGESLTAGFRAVGQVIAGMFKTLFDKLVEQERKYRMAGIGADQSTEGKEKTRQKVAGLMEEARTHFEAENIVEAENILVDVIRLQPQEKDAYTMLAQVYMKKKEFETAVETLKHLRKLTDDEEQVYYDLGRAYEGAEEWEHAVESYKQAVEIAPKNPRNLNSLLHAAIEVSDRFLARDALRRLKEADPENGKIKELEEKIDSL